MLLCSNQMISNTSNVSVRWVCARRSAGDEQKPVKHWGRLGLVAGRRREQKINPVHYLQPSSYPVTTQSHLSEKISLIFHQTILGRHWVRQGNSSQTNKKHPPAPHQQSQHRPRTWKYECKHSSPPPPTPPVFALPRAEGGNILDRIISRGLLTTVEDLLRHV